MTGMEQQEFADHIGYSRTYISSLENARRSPSLTFLARLRKVYGTSIDALIDSWNEQSFLKNQTESVDLLPHQPRTMTDMGSPLRDSQGTAD